MPNWAPMASPTSSPACSARRSAWGFRRAAWPWSAAAAPPGLSNLLHAVFLVLILAVGAGFVAHIPIPAIAGVTAWMGLCLLDWSAWRRLPKMSRVDAAAFLATALAVLCVNAVLAVAIGCSLYAARWALLRIAPELRGNPARSEA